MRQKKGVPEHGYWKAARRAYRNIKYHLFYAFATFESPQVEASHLTVYCIIKKKKATNRKVTLTQTSEGINGQMTGLKSFTE